MFLLINIGANYIYPLLAFFSPLENAFLIPPQSTQNLYFCHRFYFYAFMTRKISLLCRIIVLQVQEISLHLPLKKSFGSLFPTFLVTFKGCMGYIISVTKVLNFQLISKGMRYYK